MTTVKTHIVPRAVGLIGIAVGAAVIALAAGALASADPDTLDPYTLDFNGGTSGVSYTDFLLHDTSHSTTGPGGDGNVGFWTQTVESFAGLMSATGNVHYELYAGGVDTGNFVKEDVDAVGFGSTELWGNTVTEELNSSGTVIGMEDVVDFGGHDYTLFDTIPDALPTL